MPYSPPKTIVVQSDYMRVAEAAARLDLDPRTVLAMIRDGRLPVRVARYGTTTRIHRADFEADLERRTQAVAQD
ncbi:helix-turn-helix domain-containing protein [Streptomyces parvus]|uniref:helix-turn-helix domain-containing protein n=1 Tax=Streptomyces parvus TaxID=66428 RepID=UPI003330F19A